MNQKIKLNSPCSICNEHIVLGEALTFYNNKTYHTSCFLVQHDKELKEKITDKFQEWTWKFDGTNRVFIRTEYEDEFIKILNTIFGDEK